MGSINISIVLYKNDEIELKKAIKSCLSSETVNELFLVDNSPTDSLKKLSKLDNRIRYIFNNANIGFGSAHNIAIKISLDQAVPYHLVLNPDVYFNAEVLQEIQSYMQENGDVGLVLPKVLYPDGSIQYLAKLLPTPFDLIFRRFSPFRKFIDKWNEKYELRISGYSKIINVPNLSGCFMFLRIDSLRKTGMFDERYFMYLEDVDLCRRIHRHYRTVFYPKAVIYHGYGKGSYKNRKLLKYHLESAVKYFCKWGWFFDKERKIINKQCLQQLNQ